MTKGGDKKIGSVSSLSQTTKVKGAENVGGVEKVKATEAVGSIGSVGAVTGRKATRVMSAAERAQIFQMVQEEAEKLFPGMSEDKRKVVADAVKMAIDSGIVDEE